jgi:hypothetical protein
MMARGGEPAVPTHPREPVRVCVRPTARAVRESDIDLTEASWLGADHSLGGGADAMWHTLSRSRRATIKRLSLLFIMLAGVGVAVDKVRAPARRAIALSAVPRVPGRG